MITMIVLYIILGLIISVSIISVYIVRTIFIPTTTSHERAIEKEIEQDFFDEEYLETTQMEDVYIENDGLKLYGKYLDNKSDKTIIVMHGYTYNLYGSIKYAKPFLQNGYNALFPDQRYHGKSEGNNTTLGYKEQFDLREWIAYIQKRNPRNKLLGLHGESMGAATCLLEGHNTFVDFIISDCSFSSLSIQVKERLWKENRIPKCFVYPLSLIGKLHLDAPIIGVNPVNNIRNIKAPILLIHGTKDTYITLNHFNQLRDQLKENDMFYLCEGANHAESYVLNTKAYNDVVLQFMRNNHLI